MLVCAGGYDGNKYLGAVEAFDPRTNNWRQLAPLHHPRQGLPDVARQVVQRILKPRFFSQTQSRRDAQRLSPRKRGSIHSRISTRSDYRRVGRRDSKRTVVIGRTGFDTIPSIPDTTLSLDDIP